MAHLASHAQDCGHDAVNDEALFSSMARRGDPPARSPSGVTGLAFDERMTMHSEQSSAPHPERPDRIRAVIARLQACGLAGVLGSPMQSSAHHRAHSSHCNWITAPLRHLCILHDCSCYYHAEDSSRCAIQRAGY